MKKILGLFVLVTLTLLVATPAGSEPAPSRQKVVVIGFDGMIPEMLEKFVGEGVMPHFARLMDEGTFARALPAAPADTPTNWSTIATGAFPGTNGLNSFGMHHLGEPFDVHHNVMGNLHPRVAFAERPDQTFNGECLAQYLWQKAEKLGLKSILVNFPGNWPPNLKNGITVNGSGPYSSPTVKLAYAHRYSTIVTEDNKTITKIQLAQARGWKDLPRSGRRPLESQFTDVETGITYHILVVATGPADYDQVLITEEKSATAPLAKLLPGMSSPWIEHSFHIALSGPLAEVFYALAEYTERTFEVVARFKFHLAELSADGKRVVLERSTVYNPYHWAYPQEVADELIDYFEGQPPAPEMPISIFQPLSALNESTTTMARGIVETTRHLTKRYDWDFLFVQIHDPDGIHHAILDFLDPDNSDYSAEKAVGYWSALRKEYQLLDGMLGSILDCCVEPETLVVVVSDHGALPVRKVVRLRDYFVDAGLITYKDSDDGADLVVDWSKSRVALGDYPLGQGVWVNLKGRDPNGIVDPADYDQVREKAIHVLESVRDPESSQRVVEMAANIEDAAVWGMWGPRFGDIVYFLAPGYMGDPSVHSAGPIEKEALYKEVFSEDKTWYLSRKVAARPVVHGVHHSSLPTARLAGFSNQGIFVAKGPGVRLGYKRPQMIRLADVTPTICFWRGIPVPDDSEGGAILDIFSTRAETQETH